MSEQNFIESLNYQRKLFWQKFQLAKIDVGSAFKRAVSVRDIKLHTDYPVSFREIFNEDSHFYSSKLRSEIHCLALESPDKFAQEIKNILKTPFNELKGKTPHGAVVDKPERENYEMVKRLIRQKADERVYA